MLAFDAAGGETAMEDVPLGQVRKIFFPFFLPPRFSLFFPPPLTHSPTFPFLPLPPPKKKLHSTPTAHPRPLPRRREGQALVDDARLGPEGLVAPPRDAVFARRGQAGGAVRGLCAPDRRFRILQGHAEAR